MSFRTDALGFKCLFAPYFLFSLLLLSGSRRQSCHPFVLTAATCNISPTVAAVVAFRLRRPKTEELFPRRNRKKETKGGNHLCWLPPSSPLKAHLSFWHETRKLRFTVQNLLKKHQQDGLFICAFSFFGTELVVLKGSRLVFKILQILDGLSEERQSWVRSLWTSQRCNILTQRPMLRGHVWISFQLLLHFGFCNKTNKDY